MTTDRALAANQRTSIDVHQTNTIIMDLERAVKAAEKTPVVCGILEHTLQTARTVNRRFCNSVCDLLGSTPVLPLNKGNFD